MPLGLIRPLESQTLTVQGTELDEIQALITAQSPAGWETAAAPVSMAKKDTILTATATVVRHDGLREIGAEDMDALRALLPDGYQLLSVRRL